VPPAVLVGKSQTNKEGANVKVFGIVLAVIVGLVVMVGMMIWTGRSGLISRDEAVDAQWGQVQNVYQRRFDLVPNLVASVDNFMKRQQETLTDVISMRQRVIDLKGSLDKALTEKNPGLLDSIAGNLSQQLNSFINVVVERYPEIKGEQAYTDLMTQLEGTENRIAQERRAFNDAVREYNVFRKQGIRALMAGAIFGFEYEKTYFAAESGAQTAPSVKDAFENK
jgi:LemA protein